MPKCRLFLVVPAGLDARSGQPLVAAALSGGDVASVLISAGPNQVEMAKILKPLSRSHDAALLLEGDAASSLKLGADGVQLEAETSAYSQARVLLGEEAIVGADCQTSRHLAMTMGELGADYIGFSGLTPAESGSIIAWWARIFEVPCVALDPAAEADARVFVADGADFIRPPDSMWRDESTAALTVKSYNALIGEILR